MFSPDVPHHQANVATMAYLASQSLLDSMPPPDLTNITVTSTMVSEPVAPTAIVNVAQPASRDSALLEQMQAMMTMMMALSGICHQTGGCGRGRGRHNIRGAGGRDGQQTPLQYCHIHGACAHNGSACNNPANHHKKRQPLGT